MAIYTASVCEEQFSRFKNVKADSCPTETVTEVSVQPQSSRPEGNFVSETESEIFIDPGGNCLGYDCTFTQRQTI